MKPNAHSYDRAEFLASGISLVIGALLAFGCGPATTGPTTNPNPDPPPVASQARVEPVKSAPVEVKPPTMRLSDAASPKSYYIELALDPRKETFRGEVRIDIEVARAVDVLWLNATDLAIERAQLSVAGRKVAARTIDGGERFIGFAMDEAGAGAIGPGPVTLHASYTGKLPGHEEGGLFRRKEGDYWYIYSQFEPLDARRAFPAFDEPHFKVPFQLTLHVDKSHKAFTNTPVISESEGPAGTKTVRFQQTKPMPSYLVAIAVGPFAVVEAGTAGRNKTPIRIITPAGKEGGAKFAAESTGPILELIEEYFDSPYPYAKLDQIAVPSFLGAMENPGLVTYHQELILSEPDEDTLWRQRGYAGTCAHELAHMWFGDLVTMKWWDDLWLNESFATWMAGKIIHKWKPEWDGDVSMVRSAGFAMSSDSLGSARKIRQPIESDHDIDSAFDGITYGKGAAVLRMFEAWIGEDKFRQGIRAYMKKHAWGSATTADFLAALSGAGGAKVAGAFETFIDQSGVPLLQTELSCQKGQKPKLALTQSRYLPADSKADRQRAWQIPVCVEYGAGRWTGRSCMLMTEKKAELELDSAPRCPQWVVPNGDMAGYYRVEYDKAMLERLLRNPGKRLTVAERVGIISDMSAMTRAGKLSRAEALAWVPRLHKERNRHIASATVGMSYLSDELVPKELEANYARFVRRMYGRWARQLGWKVNPNEGDSTRLLRPSLLSLVAHKGGDKKLIAEAETLVDRWLDDRKAIHPDLVGTAISIATKNGDLALWQRFYDQAKTTTDSKERRRLLRGMAGFENPEIVKKNLAILRTDEFKLLDASILMWSALFTSSTRDMAFEFLTENFDDLLPRYPRFSASTLGFTAAAFCSVEGAAKAEAFLRPRIEKVQGGPRALAKALERANLCAASVERERPSIAAFLKKY